MSQIAVRSSRPVPTWDLLSLPTLVGHIWRYRELITQFAARDALTRHKGTMLGAAWMVVNPLLQLLVYTFLFTVIFPSKWSRLDKAGVTSEFVLTFFCGFVVYSVFSEVAGKSPGLVLDRPNLVRKVVFPLETLPVATLLSALLFGSVGLVLLLAAELVITGRIPLTALLFPIVLPPLLLLSLAAGWFLAALGVYIRDTRQVVVVVLQLFFFVTPVFYPPESVPDAYRWAIDYNPFTPIIQSARQTLLWDEQPDWAGLGIVTLIGFVLAQLGFAWFMKVKRGFPDVM
ncbi:MAG: ABC transporter permease [Phycisphaerales bacterium]|nr:ABC transporter permease [Phycisphaerales bacterium]